MTKLFIATPCFEGKCHVQYAVALSDTCMLCASHGIQVQMLLTTSGSLLCAERNRLIDAFLKSDCTHILFIDSDIGWPPQAVISMLLKDEEFIAGVYPARCEKTFQFRPEKSDDGGIKCNVEKQLLHMQYIPAGFMLLKRSAIEKMIAKHPQTYFEPKNKANPPGYALFNTEIYEGEFWGEDFVFCRLAREAGLDIWVDPMIQFDHAGNIGALREVLTNEKPAE